MTEMGIEAEVAQLKKQIKELQEKLEDKESDFRKFKADYQELCLLKDMQIDDRDKQIADLKKHIDYLLEELNERCR